MTTSTTEPLHSAAPTADTFLCLSNPGAQGGVAADPPFSSSFDYSLQASVQRTIPAVPASHER